MGQWGIPKFDLDTSFLITAGNLTLNFPDNRRRAVIMADVQQLNLLIDFTKDTSDMEMLVEYQNEQLPGSDQFFQKTTIDSSGIVLPAIFLFNATGKFQLPIAVLRTTKFIRVSVRRVGGADNSAVNLFYLDET